MKRQQIFLGSQHTQTALPCSKGRHLLVSLDKLLLLEAPVFLIMPLLNWEMKLSSSVTSSAAAVLYTIMDGATKHKNASLKRTAKLVLHVVVQFVRLDLTG